jgi:hypothetical protein
MEKDDLINKLEDMKKDYYAKNSKNMFFKSKQKLELAENISSALSVDDLLQRTVYVIKDTNKVYIDYTVFKTYANPSIYEKMVRYALFVLDYCIEKFGTYEVYLNLDTFSVSACHRYKDVIETYLNECMKHETPYTEKLITMHLYNIPSVFDNIQKLLTPFIHETVKQKIDLRDKRESPALIAELFK